MDLTINAILYQLSAIKEIVTLHLPESGGQGGRPRAEYTLSERSPLQDKLARIYDIYSLSHG